MIHLNLERPDTNNYFRFYGLEERFDIDQSELKRCYLEKSKKYHPDFYGDDPQAQNIAVATSSYNNLAYKTLSNDIRRAGYLLEIKTDKDAENTTLPGDFLMEMMELNESIDEIDSDSKPVLVEKINLLKEETANAIKDFAMKQKWPETQMEFLKWKYLERLESRL